MKIDRSRDGIRLSVAKYETICKVDGASLTCLNYGNIFDASNYEVEMLNIDDKSYFRTVADKLAYLSKHTRQDLLTAI